MENNVVKVANGIMKTPLVAPKPRPWSVAGNEGKCEFTADASKITPDAIDTGGVELIEGQSGGSIVGITPGAALGGGGSIVGISPGMCPLDVDMAIELFSIH